MRRVYRRRAVGGLVALALLGYGVLFMDQLGDDSPTPATPLVVHSGQPSPARSSPTKLGAVPTELLNPDVTQKTLSTTICVAGWTTTVRPPASYTTGLKREQLATLGASDQLLPDYEEDHWVPLELGGSPRYPGNLWPEPWPDARRKDTVENQTHRAVCSGAMTLREGQWKMYHDWAPARIAY